MRRLVISAGLIVLPMVFPFTFVRAGLIDFVDNPTSNSTDWAAQVALLGGTVQTDVDFDTHPTGALQGGFYDGLGVTLTTTGPAATVTYGAGPGQANAGSTPTSTGEGLHATSNYVFAGGGVPPWTFTVSFDNPVMAAGAFLIDLFNPSSTTARNPVTLSAYTGVDGTGTLLGTVDAAQYNFQKNYLYFMGVVSTAGDIRSIRLAGAGGDPSDFPDKLGIDNVRYASAVPEPGSLTLLASGFGGLALLILARRRCV